MHGFYHEPCIVSTVCLEAPRLSRWSTDNSQKWMNAPHHDDNIVPLPSASSCSCHTRSCPPHLLPPIPNATSADACVTSWPRLQPPRCLQEPPPFDEDNSSKHSWQRVTSSCLSGPIDVQKDALLLRAIDRRRIRNRGLIQGRSI